MGNERTVGSQPPLPDRVIPLIYLGEYHVNHIDVEERTTRRLELSAFHELGWLIMQGLNATVRYDWADTNIDFRYDSMHRVNLGFEWYPVPFLEVIADIDITGSTPMTASRQMRMSFC